MKKTFKIAIAGIVIGCIGTAATMLYRASVKEQNCLSYERQLTAEHKDLLTIILSIQNAEENIRKNPYAYYSLLPTINKLIGEGRGATTKIQDLRYAFKGTCGVKRVDSWKQKPEVISLLSELKDNVKNWH